MPTHNRVGTYRLLEASHRIQALFEMSVVALHGVVEVFRCPMFNARENCAEGRRTAFGLVRGDPLWPYTRLVDRALEERLGSLGVAPLRKVGIDHLPILVDRSVDIGPASLEPDICLVNPPFCADWTSMSAGSLTEEWQKPLDPAIHGAPVNHQASLGEPLDDIGGAQAVANVPANCQSDNIIGEGVVGESTARPDSKPASARIAAPSLFAKSGLTIFAHPLAVAPNALHDQPLINALR